MKIRSKINEKEMKEKIVMINKSTLDLSQKAEK